MAKIAIPRLELAAGMLGNSGRTATTEAANASQRTHGHSAPAEIHGVETRTPKRTSSPFRRKAAARAMTISPAASAVRASAKPIGPGLPCVLWGALLGLAWTLRGT